MSSTRPALIWSALAVVYVVWGSTYLAIRVVAESLPAFGPPAVRFGAAAVLLALGLVARRGPGVLRITRRQLVSCGLIGLLLLTVANGGVVLGESPGFAVPSGVASLIIALIPLLLVVVRAVTGDRPRVLTIVGVVLGLVGLAVLYLPGSAGGGRAIPLVGGLLVLGSAVAWAAGSYLSQRLPTPANPFVGTVYQMLAGSAGLAVLAVVRREPAPWTVPDVPVSAWVALGYLIAFGSLLSFTAYVWLLQNARLSLVSTYAYVNPIVALSLGALFVSEPLTPRLIFAAAVVLAGVAVVVSTERPSRERALETTQLEKT